MHQEEVGLGERKVRMHKEYLGPKKNVWAGKVLEQVESPPRFLKMSNACVSRVYIQCG